MLAFITSPVLWVIVRSMIPFAIGLFLSIPFSLPAELFPESYPQKIGLISGALAAGIVVGSYGGGLLYQAGFAKAAVIVPGLFAIAGALMIITSVHNRSSKNVKIDVMGFIWLFVMLTALCLVLSFASTWGYLSAPSIIGYVVTIALPSFSLKRSRKLQTRACLSSCLRTRFSSALHCLLSSAACINTSYRSIPPSMARMFWPVHRCHRLVPAAEDYCLHNCAILCAAVLKKSPRAFRSYLAISAAITIISFILLVIPGSGDNITMIYVALALTGIGEGFKNISSNPLAITTLEPQNIGIGIALMSSMGSIGLRSLPQ